MPLQMRGAYTALITPFRDGEVDVTALKALVDRQIEGGIDGLVPCGTTGEAATMSEDEQLLVIETVAERAAGRVPVIAGTGSNNTAKTIEYTRRVSEIPGVDAALVVTPYYNKPGQSALVRHYLEIAENGDLPVVLYNVPGRTAVSMTAETVARIAEHEHVIAVKEATGDMVLATRILEECGDSIALFSGDDFTTFPLLAVGGAGCVSVLSNIDPTAMHDMCAAAADGNWDEARSIHLAIQPLARALFSDTNPVPVKTAAAMLGWCGPQLRAPLYEPDDRVNGLLNDALVARGLL